MLQKLASTVEPEVFSSYLHRICTNNPGLTDVDFYSHAAARIGGTSAEELQLLWEAALRKYGIPGDAALFLHALERSSTPAILISNSLPPIRKFLLGLPFFGLLSDAILSCDVGSLKPSSEIFLRALGRNGLEPSACIMVGNSLSKDCIPAERLGIRAYWLRRNEAEHLECRQEYFPEFDASRIATISRLDELTPYLT